jgi:hypothetical protein
MLPFFMLLFSVHWEGEDSLTEKPVGCKFMFEWMNRKEIDGSVSCGVFTVDAYFKAGGFSDYLQI